MDKFFNKLDELAKALGQFNASIKQAKMPSMKPPKQPELKIPGMPAPTKKDPIKMAEQLTNAGNKDKILAAAGQVKQTIAIAKDEGINKKSYKFKHAGTKDGASTYHVMHEGNHVGTYHVAHKGLGVSGSVQPNHSHNHEMLQGAVKAFHVARGTSTDN